jgi:hypothetical protein
MRRWTSSATLPDVYTPNRKRISVSASAKIEFDWNAVFDRTPSLATLQS